MAISSESLRLIQRKRRICGQTGGHTFGRGYPTITGKFTDEMTVRDRQKLSKALSKGAKPKIPKGP